MTQMVDSASDERIVNNDFRHKYRVLDDSEKEAMTMVKDHGLQFNTFLEELKKGDPRSFAIAKTKMQEAVFWAVHGITG